MNKIIFLFLSLFLTLTVFSQSNPKADPRVIDFFGAEKISVWAVQSPDSIEYYNFFVNNSFKILSDEYAANYDESKNATLTTLSDKNFNALEHPSEFNILMSGLQFHVDKMQWFKVKGTNYFILLKSLNHINAKFSSKL